MSHFKDVLTFHETYNMPIAKIGEKPSVERAKLRIDLILEEFDELFNAITGFGKGELKDTVESATLYKGIKELANYDRIEVADALADLLYVTYGAAIEFGIPIEDVFDEVHRSNMSKLGVDSKPIYREDGKVLKGPNFFEPDIKGILGYE